ncbi:hypothetical protein [Salinarchaeum laminariae]|uniref:hypothetical protein n=1 Tax=Salinarchaeum laminariae TaxID=869888 RepID=UPI0020BEE63C|nr:hypothetical protein [Salinarchaeum laminariae]
MHWRLSDDPPETPGNAGDDPDPDAGGLPEPCDRDERAATAEFLASVASADPDEDPLAGVENRGGHRLGCDPEAPHA